MWAGRKEGREEKDMTYLYNMINVPTRLATLTLANTTDNHSTRLAVARLNSTKTSMNFQSPGTVGTRPASPYTMLP